MKRPRIDVAVHAQLDRRISLLRDVVRSGGKDKWSHLRSHGHHYPTTLCALRQGYLSGGSYHYEITEQGEQHLAAIDAAQLMDQQ